MNEFLESLSPTERAALIPMGILLWTFLCSTGIDFFRWLFKENIMKSDRWLKAAVTGLFFLFVLAVFALCGVIAEGAPLPQSTIAALPQSTLPATCCCGPLCDCVQCDGNCCRIKVAHGPTRPAPAGEGWQWDNDLKKWWRWKPQPAYQEPTYYYAQPQPAFFGGFGGGFGGGCSGGG